MSAPLRTIVLFVAVVLASVGPDAEAYLKLGTRIGSNVSPLKWASRPIRYFIENRDVPGVSAGDLRQIIARVFATWAEVPNIDIASEFVGFTDAVPFDDDGVSVIGFRARPDLDRILGATTFTVDAVTGALIESDIFLNTAFDWSIVSSGQPGRFDVESIALHEVGHFLGLSHSALGETELVSDGRRRVLGKAAVMFPIAFPSGNVVDRSLYPDDRAGLSDLYATDARDDQLGSLAGRVTLNGAGVFGAHVIAMNIRSGDLVGSFALDENGAFVVSGLTPGLYVVRAEPIDDADVDSFFSEERILNVNFRPAYAARLASVAPGGGAQAIDIKVLPK